jgi:ubiquinol-cytochrome c reductase cytochrome b subunit
MHTLKQIWMWFDDRTGASAVWKETAGHLVPRGTGWWYVFGSATLAAFLVQVFTGIALATIYVPSTADAYHTLEFITYQAKCCSSVSMYRAPSLWRPTNFPAR